MTRKNIIIDTVSYIFVILFVYTGISKLLLYQQFRFDLINAPFIKKLEPIMAIAVPVIELLIATCLLIPKAKKVGLYSSLIIMTLFTIYVGGILSFAKNKPCTCGGVLRSLSWGQHLLLNIALTLSAMLALHLLKKKSDITNHSAQYKPAI